MKQHFILYLITLLLVAAEIEASTYHNRRLVKLARNRLIILHRSTQSIYNQLHLAAVSGKFRKLTKAIRLADEHGLEFKHRGAYFGFSHLGNLLQDVATGGNVKSLLLMLEYADKHNFPKFSIDSKFDSSSYSTRVSDMLAGAAQYGHTKAITAVVRLVAERKGILLTADDFTRAIQFATYNAETKAIKHIYAIAKQSEGLDPKRFSDEALSGAAQSGDAQTIELVAEIAAESGILLESKHWGRALQLAAWEGYRATSKVIALVDASDVKIRQKDFVDAMARAVGNYSTYRMEQIADFATTRQHITFSADDLGLIMELAAVRIGARGIKNVLKVADKHSITLNRKHFVAAMQQTVQSGNYETLEHIVKIATEYGTLLTGDDLATVIIEGMNSSSLRYGETFPAINNLVIRYDIKLERRHFSRLLAKAVELSQFKNNIGDAEIRTVIDFAVSNDVAIDADYFATAISHTTDVKVIDKLNELASDRDIKL